MTGLSDIFGLNDGCTGAEPFSLSCAFSAFIVTAIGLGFSLLDSLINLGTDLGITLPTLPF